MLCRLLSYKYMAIRASCFGKKKTLCIVNCAFYTEKTASVLMNRAVFAEGLTFPARP